MQAQIKIRNDAATAARAVTPRSGAPVHSTKGAADYGTNGKDDEQVTLFLFSAASPKTQNPDVRGQSKLVK
jgi:hypothetical protein